MLSHQLFRFVEIECLNHVHDQVSVIKLLNSLASKESAINTLSNSSKELLSTLEMLIS